tara:strand:- start:3 stop:227 length:225 start_codon:yes stop_codon:yes gene_type:complete
MSKNELTKKQKNELNRLTVAMVEEAISVKMDYEQNVSNLDSGSVVVVHQNSPLLDDEKEKLSEVAYNITKKGEK